ncbi:MAG: dienelactone hydrolase family protein [Anaerolineaceae bacterium]|nr:dienelactone hydrolase family protein [Anaerolineaceae bacterium]
MLITWISIILTVILLFLLLAGFIFSSVVMYSHRQPIVRTPKDYGMEYEDISFPSLDNLTIKGWLIPGTKFKEKVLLITHPFPFNRHGFISKNQGFPPLAFKDVDLLKTAQVLHHEGYSVMMMDFRNHGESAAGISAVGLNEYQDTAGAVRYLKQHPDLQHTQIGLVSFCMGADASIIAFSKAAAVMQGVKFLVAIQPVSAEVFVKSYLRAVYTPASLILAPIVDWFIQKRGGHALSVMSPIAYAKDVHVPILHFQAPADKWTTIADTQTIFDNFLSEEKELVWLEGINHRFTTYNHIAEHPEKVIEFFDMHFD